MEDEELEVATVEELESAGPTVGKPRIGLDVEDLKVLGADEVVGTVFDKRSSGTVIVVRVGRFVDKRLSAIGIVVKVGLPESVVF
jgi:hypothetical protein